MTPPKYRYISENNGNTSEWPPNPDDDQFRSMVEGLSDNDNERLFIYEPKRIVTTAPSPAQEGEAPQK